MDLFTNKLLINFLFILLALCYYKSYISLPIYSSTELKAWLIALFPIVSFAFCMLVPLISTEDNIWDLRYIPFILGGLYGGYKLGLVQIGMALLIRYLLGGLGFYSASVVIIITGISICTFPNII